MYLQLGRYIIEVIDRHLSGGLTKTIVCESPTATSYPHGFYILSYRGESDDGRAATAGARARCIPGTKFGEMPTSSDLSQEVHQWITDAMQIFFAEVLRFWSKSADGDPKHLGRVRFHFDLQCSDCEYWISQVPNDSGNSDAIYWEIAQQIFSREIKHPPSASGLPADTQMAWIEGGELKVANPTFTIRGLSGRVPAGDCRRCFEIETRGLRKVAEGEKRQPLGQWRGFTAVMYVRWIDGFASQSDDGSFPEVSERTGSQDTGSGTDSMSAEQRALLESLTMGKPSEAFSSINGQRL